ncbi:MAG: four helix bundle protein [Candidatus Moranbacteria bacterium]|nr:four helix bundle protein [Candidatus Moranbacteria bacterium]
MIETKENKYDLESRTSKFGSEVILFCRKIPQDTITKPLISQIIRSATSIGANYMEANAASSKKDFKNKIHICKKESQESKYWLHMVSVAHPEATDDARRLWKEVQELTLIFGKIISTLKN